MSRRRSVNVRAAPASLGVGTPGATSLRPCTLHARGPLVNPGADHAAASPPFSPALSPLGDRQRSYNFPSASFSSFLLSSFTRSSTRFALSLLLARHSSAPFEYQRFIFYFCMNIFYYFLFSLNILQVIRGIV